MLQSLFDHFSPDLRTEDTPYLLPFKQEHGLLHVDPYHHYWPTADGRKYSCHFWLYPLFALPAKALLHATGANEYKAFQVTNAALFVLALGIALFNKGAPTPRHWMLVGLSGVSPVIWYLFWPSTEAFTWSFVLISLVLLGNRHYVGAAVAASVGAMQNPPVLFLAFFAVLLSCRECSLRLTLFAAIGASLSLLPCLFYYANYGVPNLITAHQGTDFGRVSFSRTWSFLTDLNQGLLPFLPLTLFLGIAAVYRIMATKRLAAAGMLLVFAAMMLCSESTTNWNSGAVGLMRYAVWMIPILAWLVVETLPATRVTYTLVAASVAVQAAIVGQHDGQMDWQDMSPLASFVLSKAPILYSPEPEIFFERQGVIPAPSLLPFPFVTKDYRVTKVLADSPSFARLSERFIIEPAYFEEVKRRYEGREGLFYLTPPKGAIKLRPRPTAEEFAAWVKMAVIEVPARVDSPLLAIKVVLSNTGSVHVLPAGPRPRDFHPFGVAYSIPDREEGEDEFYCVYVPQILHAGESIPVTVAIPLRRRKGEYAIDVQSVMEGIAFGKEATRLAVNVLTEPDSAYAAEITVRQCAPVRPVDSSAAQAYRRWRCAPRG